MSSLLIPESEISQRFARIVADSLRIDPSLVTEDAYLDDLGAESLDLVEITLNAENEFHVTVPEKDILQMAQEVFGEGVLVKDDMLTEEGKRFMHNRMPELQPAKFEGSVAELKKSFLQVRTWVNMILRLMEHTPHECPSCHTALVNTKALRMKCPNCGAEQEIPSGDDLNRKWVQDYHDRFYQSAITQSPKNEMGA